MRRNATSCVPVVDVGADTGEAVGKAVGADTGKAVGEAVGADTGEAVGKVVGADTGKAVGEAAPSQKATCLLPRVSQKCACVWGKKKGGV